MPTCLAERHEGPDHLRVREEALEFCACQCELQRLVERAAIANCISQSAALEKIHRDSRRGPALGERTLLSGEPSRAVSVRRGAVSRRWLCERRARCDASAGSKRAGALPSQMTPVRPVARPSPIDCAARSVGLSAVGCRRAQDARTAGHRGSRGSPWLTSRRSRRAAAPGRCSAATADTAVRRTGSCARSRRSDRRIAAARRVACGPVRAAPAPAGGHRCFARASAAGVSRRVASHSASGARPPDGIHYRE